MTVVVASILTDKENASPNAKPAVTSKIDTDPMVHKRPVLLYVVNVAWFFNLHRLHLANAARAAGYEVHVATAPDFAKDVEQIMAAGLLYHPLKLTRGRWGFLQELALTASLFKLYRKIRPDVVHHVTIKPVLCGTFAARLARVQVIVNSVSGLGFIFTAVGRWAWVRRRIVEVLYRIVHTSRATHVIFENSDDLRLFVDNKIIQHHQATLIRGVGVDLSRFRYADMRGELPLVVLPARMLWDKGVREFCEAAARLRESGLNARFVLVGGIDTENPAGIPVSWLAQQQCEAIEWWGWRDDMAAVYAQAHVVCLPSYREGLPTVLLEAGACGCALVATDVAGCREVVRDGDTGLLVPAKDVDALEQALKAVILDASLRARLRASARQYIEAEFSAEKIRAATTRLYSESMGAS